MSIWRKMDIIWLDKVTNAQVLGKRSVPSRGEKGGTQIKDVKNVLYCRL